MIYLHPSRRIKDTEPAGNIVISESLLDEHLSHIAYFVGDKRPFTLRIEASNGVVLDEHSTTATELSVRIYTSEGVDVTEFVSSLNPSWQIGAVAVGQGLSYTVQASSLKSWHTKIVVTTSAARILDAMGKLQGKTAEEQRLLEGLTIDASIEVRRDFVLLQRIPTAELIRDTLKLDKEFIAATTGKQGAPGKDAAPIRPNLFEFASLDKNSREQGGLRIDEVTAGKRLSAGTTNIHGGRDLTRITTGVAVQLDLVIYRTARENGEFKRNLTLRTMRPPNNEIYSVRSKPYPEEPGTYHMELICPINKEQSQNPKELYIHAWLLDWGRGFIDCELRNVKVEYLYEGEPQKCSAYIPNTSDMIPLLPKIENGEWLLPDQLTRKYLSTGVKAKGEDGTPGAMGEPGKSVTPQEVVSALNTNSFRESVSRLIDLNKLAASAASKVVGTSTLLTKVREGMATYSDLQSIKAQVDGHQVNWDTLEVNYIDPIRQLQNQLKAKQAEIEGNVDKDIIRFVYRAALQSEWSDYPSTEWVGSSGYNPDPWGGGAPEGYYRTVHHYELWRNMDSTPPIHIEQSKRTLRQKEYQASGKSHRDGSATIVYDIQSLGGIESGRARHWRLFTTHHATSILRYGGKTYMGNPSSSGYTNFALDSGTTYDIYAYNSGGNKYELFIVKDGTYK